MGYTHYWRQPLRYTKAEWEQICKDVTAILNDVQHVQGIPLADGMGGHGSSPEITDDRIWFNGVGDNSHETFIARRSVPPLDADEKRWKTRRGSDFCKTARKPYDIAVTACLAYFAAIERGPWRASSDGDGPDWLAGVALARRCVPRLANQIDIPMPIMKSDRWDWRTKPFRGSNYTSYIDVQACIDGYVYVFDIRDESRCYRFPTATEAHQYFQTFKERPITVRGSREGGELFNAFGSFNATRSARLKRDQTRVLTALLDCAASEGRNIRPPAFARPNEMPGVPREQATLADLYRLCA